MTPDQIEINQEEPHLKTSENKDLLTWHSLLTHNTSIGNQHYKINKITNILQNLTSEKSSQTEELKKQDLTLLDELKGTLFEWSLLTKFECLSKVFEYKKTWARVVWALIFVVFSALTAWLVFKCVSDYHEYAIVTKTESVNDRPSEFPAITLCNKNPFSSHPLVLVKYTCSNYGHIYYNFFKF